MITNFIIVPTYVSELLMWFAIGVYFIAAALTLKARRSYLRADKILKEKTKEMEDMLAVVRRDATTLHNEIEEVRKLKLQ